MLGTSCLEFWKLQCCLVSSVSVYLFVLRRLKLSYPGSTCGCRSTYSQQVLNTNPAMIEQWTSRESLRGSRVIGLSGSRRDSMVRDTWPLKFKAAGFFCENGRFYGNFCPCETVVFLALVWLLWSGGMTWMNCWTRVDRIVSSVNWGYSPTQIFTW